MELKYLKTFQTIVREGGFTRAARKLNYTQSTITFQVQQMEQELSAKLFEKVGRRMVLTKAGEGLIPYVDETLLSLEKMLYFQKDLQEYRGELHVGVAETLLSYRLPGVLKAFHKRAPQAQLLLRSMNCQDIRDELVGGTLELGVFYRDVGGISESLVTQSAGQYPVVLVASPALAARHEDFVSDAHEVPLTVIVNEERCVFRQKFEGYLQQKSICMENTMELRSVHAIKTLVQSDVGVSVLPRFVMEEELKSGRLVELETQMGSPTVSAVCGRHKNKWVSPLMQLFLDLCKEELGD